MRFVSILAAVFLFMATSSLTQAADKTASEASKSLVVGGGCFWCTEATFELLPGVTSVVSGYAGGKTENPSYEAVCSGITGHAEVIKINYDPSKITLAELLDTFWIVHDPTTLNRQGADRGTQYRSIILYTDAEQKAAAEKSIAAAQDKFADKIVTEVKPLEHFYTAEDHHQDYFRNNPYQGYCQAVIRPKVDKLKKTLAK